VEPPWKDIGYHYGIELVNVEYEIIAGRMIDTPGAHCSAGGMNHRSIGICFVGNFDLVAPNEDQWDLGLKLVRALCEIGSIDDKRVFGHREIDGMKSCPGRKFDMVRFRRAL
jgi:hypothetical protein